MPYNFRYKILEYYIWVENFEYENFKRLRNSLSNKKDKNYLTPNFLSVSIVNAPVDNLLFT